MARILLFFLMVTGCAAKAQDFTGIIRYRLSVTGSTVSNTDSMTVVFDKTRVMIILYIPDSLKHVHERRFMDDFKEGTSYTIDDEKKTYRVDSMKPATRYNFINTNSIGAAVNNELCIRYKTDSKKPSEPDAECLGGINFRNSFMKDYAFLGYQPLIVDNRIIMDFKETLRSGTRSSITVYDIRRAEDVDPFFKFDSYTEVK